MAKSITFVLPGHDGKPVGGYKVVYQYANCLASRGHEVSIVHAANCHDNDSLLIQSVKFARYVQRTLDKSYLPRKWFDLDARVRVLWVPSLKGKFIPDADVIVATAWQTAEWVAGYVAAKGWKHYLIQHYEIWSGPEERVRRTWMLPLRKIVIAKWLEEIANQLGQDSIYIPNGLDFSRFGVDVPINERNPRSVMMLYHDQTWKGSQDGIQALFKVREFCPDLKVTMFGVRDGRNLPAWVEYHCTPEQKVLRSLYNRAAVFIAPSWTEGWGLPPAESMMCGCALVATDNGGHREFAKNDVTALVTKARDPESLAQAVLRLIENPDKRATLARSGNEHIQQFTLGRACDRFENVILGRC